MLTNSMLLESTPAQAVRFAGTSTLPKWRERADRRRSNSRPAPSGYADAVLKFEQELLSRLLIDEEESLNRLYNIVSQVGTPHLIF